MLNNLVAYHMVSNEEKETWGDLLSTTYSQAFYLCGLLLCSTVQRFILSFHIMLQVGDIFKHMKLPEYDPTNGQHFLLAKLVKEAHTTTDKINRQTLLEQISNIGNSIIENWNLL